MKAYSFRTLCSEAVSVSVCKSGKGIPIYAGMDVLHVDGVTGLIDTNYDGKIHAALDFLDRGDFVYVHVEAPDECGHMGDAELKKQAIELFDERIVAPAIEATAGTDAVIVVTCDHFTPVARRKILIRWQRLTERLHIIDGNRNFIKSERRIKFA